MIKGRDKHLHCTRWLFVGGDAHIAPLSTTEFAVAFHKNSFFCGRTEASALTHLPEVRGNCERYRQNVFDVTKESSL